MRIPDNSIQLENIKEHVKTMICIPVTIGCVCARGKFSCISTLSVFVLMFFQAPLSAGMLAIAVLIFEPVTAENGLLSSWSMSSVVRKSSILPLLDFQKSPLSDFIWRGFI